MFFDLKPGRLAWIVADENGAITAAVPGSLELLAPYSDLQSFIGEWSQEWSAWAPEAPSLAREMPGNGERSRLLLEAAPIVPTGTIGVNSPAANGVLICVSLPEDHRSKIASLREKFDLTVAECRVAAEAAKGCTPAEVALAVGLSVHTVRSHLKRIFLKMGVHSQGALVWALLEGQNENSMHSGSTKKAGPQAGVPHIRASKSGKSGSPGE